MLKLGEVKLPSDEDFSHVKRICENNDGWTLNYSKGALKVYVKQNELSLFQMLKAVYRFDDVSANTVYSVMHDGEYRPEWDDKMLEGVEICYLSPFSDIGYYQVKSPKPFKNRDFVTQRCWLDYGEGRDKIIYNHSVNHAKFPPRKGCVRGISFLTGIHIQPTGNKSCQMSYVSQADPGGSFPIWVVNVVTRVLTPKLTKKIHKATQKYDKWKAKHNPDYRPWADPEKIRCPKIDWNDISTLDLGAIKPTSADMDESNLKESDIAKADLDESNLDA